MRIFGSQRQTPYKIIREYGWMRKESKGKTVQDTIFILTKGGFFIAGGTVCSEADGQKRKGNYYFYEDLSEILNEKSLKKNL
jgi:hypothetical protein